MLVQCSATELRVQVSSRVCSIPMHRGQAKFSLALSLWPYLASDSITNILILYLSTHFFFHFIGPCPPKSNEFFLFFVCDYLLKVANAGDYVELRENPAVLHLKDLDKISDIYCDYKDQKTTSGKKLNREKKNRLDNIKNTIKLYEKGQAPSLKKVGNGVMYGKEFLACEIKDSALWCSLKRSFRLMVMQYLLNYYICK